MNTCGRCGKENVATILSMFNREHLCLECKDHEKKHPKYAQAEAAEKASVSRGETVFEGIGCPPELYGKE
jgi:hypothetical protein